LVLEDRTTAAGQRLRAQASRLKPGQTWTCGPTAGSPCAAVAGI